MLGAPNTTTTPEIEGQQTTELNEPWSLHFDRDGTEDFGIICDAEMNDLVASHLPSTRLGDKTFATGTFWLPEKNDPTPLRVRQMWVMTAAPRLLAALTRCSDLLADYDEAEGEEGEAYREALAAIAEAKGLAA